MYDYTEPHLLGDFLRCSLVIKGLISLKKVVSQDDLCFLSDEIQCPLEVAMQGSWALETMSADITEKTFEMK